MSYDLKPDFPLQRALTVGGAVILTLGLVLLVRWACGYEHRQGRVETLEWRQRTVLRERTVASDGEWGNAPVVAGYYNEPTFNHDCYSKFHHTRCTKVGKSSVCVPIYQHWCDYSYYSWPAKEYIETQGDGHQTFYDTFGAQLDKDHRETHEGWYTISFTDEKEHWRYQTRNYDEYLKYRIDDVWLLKFPNIGSMHPEKQSELETSTANAVIPLVLEYTR